VNSGSAIGMKEGMEPLLQMPIRLLEGQHQALQ
jgi:hypothetical protein